MLEDIEKIIQNSGLFNLDFYLGQFPDVKTNEAIAHFISKGAEEGASPSFLFDTRWYLQQYRDVADSDLNPLLHYILFGASEHRIPSPYIDPYHLQKIKDLAGDEFAISYFYKNERELEFSINPHFDVKYYLENNEDVNLSGISPVYHFIYSGVQEWRKPKFSIDLVEYCKLFKVNPNVINPFLHFIMYYGDLYLEKISEKKYALEQPQEYALPDLEYNRPGPDFEKPLYKESKKKSKIKPLAFYLPQFHPFKENDEWWGKGFTEWRNVVRGRSRFKGHYQPHLPSDLGFYDLRVKDVFKQQADLAKASGVHGFCFYHYWFNGKRLMEKPIDMFLENRDIDIPFCLMWANENWTRTWDGYDNDVLIAQDYYEEDDVPFIKDLGRHFKDERYIRVNGRPLFIIYRPGIIPDAKSAIKKWRKICEEQLGEKPLFYMAQAFDDTDPRLFDLDGAIEFPPHKVAAGLPDASRAEGVIDPAFTGHYPSYEALIASSLSETEHPFPLIRGVTPSWDNEARKPGRGMGYVGATPKKYEKWLKSIAQYALSNPIEGEESFVMINAWNEWAEGAHLEPDVYNGHAYLNATYRAVHSIESFENKTKVILVGHDAYKHGAQLLTLNIFKTLKQTFGIDVVCILLEGGPLVGEYQKVGTTHVTDGSSAHFKAIIEDLNRAKSYQYAICNTLVTGHCAKILNENSIESIQLVHELSNLIKEYDLEDNANCVAKHSKGIVFAADFVRRSFNNVVESLDKDKVHVIPQGIYQNLNLKNEFHISLREKLGLHEECKIIVNTGFADLRKGFDLFISIANKLVDENKDYHFVWVGDVKKELSIWLLDSLDSELRKNIHIVPFTVDVARYVRDADCFALTSREDPFPSVVLESLALGTPVVAFENCGGFEDPISIDFNGRLVKFLDIDGFANEIKNQIETNSKYKVDKRINYARSKYDWSNYVFSLVELLMNNLKRVSVVIPNYNYENHIEERLISIFNQKYPVYEIIVLDDKSSDGSVDLIKQVAEIHQRDVILVENSFNSGSVFKQWTKGAKLASGDYLWIAEADDSATNEFLVESMNFDGKIQMSYSDSLQIDENSNLIAEDYFYYYEKNMKSLLSSSCIVEGEDFIRNCLSVKNQLMNVSAMTFHRSTFVACLTKNIEKLSQYKVAGDWFIYSMMLLNGCYIKLIGKSLNIHRRHSSSVTHSNLAIQIEEIKSLQEYLGSHFNDESIMNEQIDYLTNLREQIAK